MALARALARKAGIELGAIPVVLIMAPFFYWGFREAPAERPEPDDRRGDEEKLESAATNPRLSAATRQEAQRRLDELRASKPDAP